MKTHHRIPKPLAVVLAIALLFGLVPAAHAADHLVSTPGELTTALSAADGDTIRLTANIVYNDAISIEDKTITLDVQSFDLTVNSTSSSGLYVENGGVALVGTGAFDVSGYSYGVTADAGGAATVTSATATRPDGGAGVQTTGGAVQVLEDVTGFIGVYAEASGGVDILGDVHANGSGSPNAIYALSGAGVAVYGSLDSSLAGNAAYAAGTYSQIYIGGSVTASASGRSIYANSGGRIVVDGDVQALGGVWANNATISISGSVTAAETDGIGAEASGGGQIIIGTSITADVYARVNAVNKGISDRTVPTTKLCFATYSEGLDSVWVLTPQRRFFRGPGDTFLRRRQQRHYHCGRGPARQHDHHRL